MKVKNTICQNFGDKIEAKHLKVTFEIEAAGWLLVIVGGSQNNQSVWREKTLEMKFYQNIFVTKGPEIFLQSRHLGESLM